MNIQKAFLFTICIVLCGLIKTGRAQVIPNDSLYSEQDYLDDINIEGAWNFTTGNTSQAIAILMPGGSLGHEDLASKLSFQTQRIFDSQYLGAATPFAGIVGAATNNGIGIAGINWKSDVYSYDVGKIRTENIGPNDSPVQFLDLNKSKVDDDIDLAVNQGAKTILLPFTWLRESNAAGLEVPKFRISPDFIIGAKEFLFANIKNAAEAAFSDDYHYETAFEAAKEAYLDDAVIIGKTLDYNGSARGFPANLAKDRISIAVGSTSLSPNNPFEYSSSATTSASEPGYSDIDVVAPGVNILSTFNKNSTSTYEEFTGTATAASIGTGVVSLMQAEDPNLKPDDIKEILSRTADDIGDPGYDTKSGFGRINATEAFNYINERNFTRKTAENGSTTKLDNDRTVTLFNGVWGPYASGTYSIDPYEIEFLITIPKLQKEMDFWFRAKDTKGISLANPNFQSRFAEIVDVNKIGGFARVKTYIYFMESGVGFGLNEWFPAHKNDAKVAYTIASKHYTQNTENVFIQNATINSNKTYNSDVGIDDNVTLTISDNVTFNGDADIYLHSASNLVVANNGELNLQPGTTVYLDSNAEINVNSGGKITADGVTFKPLPNSSDNWKHIKLLGGYNTFTNCTFEGAEKAIYSASYANVVERGIFTDNQIAVYSTSELIELRGVTMQNGTNGIVSRGTGTVKINSIYGASFEQPSRITGHNKGVRVYDYGSAYVHHTEFSLNNYHAYASEQGRLYAGKYENDGSKGYNSFSTVASNYDIYNSAVTSSGATWTAQANYNWWGFNSPPASGRFQGSVQENHPLSCNPTIDGEYCDPQGSGGGGGDDDPCIIGTPGCGPVPEAPPEGTTLIAGSGSQAGQYSTTDSGSPDWVSAAVGGLLSYIKDNPDDPRLYRYLQEVYHLLQTHDIDKSMRRQVQFEKKLNRWMALYLKSKGVAGNSSDELPNTDAVLTGAALMRHPQVLDRLGRMAVLLAIDRELREGNYGKLHRLTDAWAPHVDNQDDNISLLSAKAVAWEQAGAFGSALAAYEQMEQMNGGPNAPDYAMIKAELADSMEARKQVKRLPQAIQTELTGKRADNKVTSFKVNAPYPNPFNPATTISFQVPVQSRVSITVYNMLGRKVRVLTDRFYQAGVHEVRFAADNLSSGTYFIRTSLGGKLQVQKVTLIK